MTVYWNRIIIYLTNWLNKRNRRNSYGVLEKYGAYGIPVCLLLASLLLYPRLPNELPMQFSLSGEVNRTMNKEFAFWCIPVLEAVILLYTDCTDNRIAGLAIAILLTIIQLGIMLLVMR